jgi:DNA repair photolyase
LFCYCRETKYCPHDDPADFAYTIQVKENAPELLRRALSRLPVDLVMTGDYQAAERKFGLSRKMRCFRRSRMVRNRWPALVVGVAGNGCSTKRRGGSLFPNG